jgi:hypothetical protein
MLKKIIASRKEMTMLKKIMMLSAITAVLALTVALPASANSIPTTGNKLSILNPPTTYPANTPFYVLHGVACFTNSNVDQCTRAGTYFVLYVDGVQQPSQRYINEGVTEDGIPYLQGGNLTNFPDGLPAGTYTFTGVFYVAGSFLVERSATITFT